MAGVVIRHCWEILGLWQWAVKISNRDGGERRWPERERDLIGGDRSGGVYGDTAFVFSLYSSLWFCWW